MYANGIDFIDSYVNNQLNDVYEKILGTGNHFIFFGFEGTGKTIFTKFLTNIHSLHYGINNEKIITVKKVSDLGKLFKIEDKFFDSKKLDCNIIIETYDVIMMRDLMIKYNMFNFNIVNFSVKFDVNYNLNNCLLQYAKDVYIKYIEEIPELKKYELEEVIVDTQKLEKAIVDTQKLYTLVFDDTEYNTDLLSEVYNILEKSDIHNINGIYLYFNNNEYKLTPWGFKYNNYHLPIDSKILQKLYVYIVKTRNGDFEINSKEGLKYMATRYPFSLQIYEESNNEDIKLFKFMDNGMNKSRQSIICDDTRLELNKNIINYEFINRIEIKYNIDDIKYLMDNYVQNITIKLINDIYYFVDIDDNIYDIPEKLYKYIDQINDETLEKINKWTELINTGKCLINTLSETIDCRHNLQLFNKTMVKELHKQAVELINPIDNTRNMLVSEPTGLYDMEGNKYSLPEIEFVLDKYYKYAITDINTLKIIYCNITNIDTILSGDSKYMIEKLHN